jgi:hypothetical protein
VDDSSVIGICGETKLQNEEGSWWTMIQVYEYYSSPTTKQIYLHTLDYVVKNMDIEISLIFE